MWFKRCFTAQERHSLPKAPPTPPGGTSERESPSSALFQGPTDAVAKIEGPQQHIHATSATLEGASSRPAQQAQLPTALERTALQSESWDESRSHSLGQHTTPPGQESSGQSTTQGSICFAAAPSHQQASLSAEHAMVGAGPLELETIVEDKASQKALNSASQGPSSALFSSRHSSVAVTAAGLQRQDSKGQQLADKALRTGKGLAALTRLPSREREQAVPIALLLSSVHTSSSSSRQQQHSPPRASNSKTMEWEEVDGEKEGSKKLFRSSAPAAAPPPAPAAPSHGAHSAALPVLGRNGHSIPQQQQKGAVAREKAGPDAAVGPARHGSPSLNRQPTQQPRSPGMQPLPLPPQQQPQQQPASLPLQQLLQPMQQPQQQQVAAMSVDSLQAALQANAAMHAGGHPQQPRLPAHVQGPDAGAVNGRGHHAAAHGHVQPYPNGHMHGIPEAQPMQPNPAMVVPSPVSGPLGQGLNLNHITTLQLDALSREVKGLVWIGQGGGGCVFKGAWQGAEVGIKFMAAKTIAAVNSAALEALVSTVVNHPNVVQTYAFDVTKLTDASFRRQHNSSTLRSLGGSRSHNSFSAHARDILGSLCVTTEGTEVDTPRMSPNGATSPLASSEGHQLQQQQPGAPLSGPLPQAQSAYAPSRLGAQYRGPVSEGGAAPGGNSNALVLQGPQAAQAANHGGPAAAGAVAGAGGQGERRASGPAQMQPPQEVISSFTSNDGFGDPEVCAPNSWTVLHVLQYLQMQPGMYLTHIIMEYCDRGSLLAALKRGVFRVGGTSGDADRFSQRVVLRALMRTARDVARGMQHLHASGIIHGDLKPGNVLLKGSRNDRRGFVAKVSDFGLSKVVRGEAPLEAHHWSTITHMAPEVIQGKWLKASDVFSFGILLWQLVTGETMPYGKLTVPQILVGVSQGTLRPEWPEHAHAGLVKLGRACLAQYPERRPSFEDIAKVLTKLEVRLRDELRSTPRK